MLQQSCGKLLKICPSKLHEMQSLSGKTTSELAASLKVSYDLLQVHLAGRCARMRPQLCQALTDAGFDGEALSEDFRRWVEERAAAEQRSLRDALARNTVDPMLHAAVR